LKEHAVLDAAYNSLERQAEYASMCQLGTRERVMQEILDWAERDDDKPICWLYGPAGSGKSTIAHTVAEECGDKLAASFFFSRGKGRRSAITGLLPTLAYQLAIHQPPLRPLIESTLRADPSILSQTLENQFRKLIIEPIMSIENPPPMVIVLDALDECGDGDLLMKIVGILCNAPTNHPLPFRCFLTSRPEEHIRDAFALPGTHRKTHSVKLYDFDARHDIRAFLQKEFEDILCKREVLLRAVPRPWPSLGVLDELVDKSEGLFIYVSTLVKYVGQGPGLPQDKLQAVSKIHAGIDFLYMQVLSTALQSPHSRLVIGTLMLLSRPLQINAMAQLLQLTPAVIRDALRGCHSVLIIPDDDDGTIKPYHASLRDFLTDDSRSEDYSVDPALNQTITQYCMHIMTSSLMNDAIGNEPLPYACQNWTHHFSVMLASGRGSELSRSPFTQEVTIFLKNLRQEGLKSWMYNIQGTDNMKAAQKAAQSSIQELKCISSIPKDVCQELDMLQKIVLYFIDRGLYYDLGYAAGGAGFGALSSDDYDAWNHDWMMFVVCNCVFMSILLNIQHCLLQDNVISHCFICYIFHH